MLNKNESARDTVHTVTATHSNINIEWEKRFTADTYTARDWLMRNIALLSMQLEDEKKERTEKEIKRKRKKKEKRINIIQNKVWEYKKTEQRVENRE